MTKDSVSSKIKAARALTQYINRLKKSGRHIVFTNGCFDILHPGHIAYLKKAKALGDVLVIGLNSDTSVRRLKGKGRPILPQRKRAEILASLEVVDFVTVFGEPTPIRLIKNIRPHILVKGADWNKKDIVGKTFVESHGGCVKRIPYIKGYSTTSIIKKILKTFPR